VREINVSRTGDPVHAGDEALTQETPAQRGRVNRYDLSPFVVIKYNVFKGKNDKNMRFFQNDVLFSCKTF
jgi:hypothetical protein